MVEEEMKRGGRQDKQRKVSIKFKEDTRKKIGDETKIEMGKTYEICRTKCQGDRSKSLECQS